MSNKTHALDLLAQYSSEESNGEEDSIESSKVSSPLPVPEVLSKLFNERKTLNSSIDDPALHDGRVRSFPHVRGNWSTFVYVPYECNQEVCSLFNHVVKLCGGIANLKPIEEPHISLTRTVILQHHWIDILVDDIKKSLSQIKRFPISFSSFGIYCNDERTRTFLSLQLSEGRTELLECVELMNKCLYAFKLPPFYEDASFHLSIAWCVGDKSEELKSRLPELNLKLQNLPVEASDQFKTVVDKIECKVGKKLFRFELR